MAVLAADGIAAGDISEVREALTDQGVIVEVLALVAGQVRTRAGGTLTVDRALPTTRSVLYDGVFVPGGDSTITLREHGEVLRFVAEAFRHGKAVAATGTGVDLLRAAGITGVRLADEGGPAVASHGVVTRVDRGNGDDLTDALCAALAAHRHFDR